MPRPSPVSLPVIVFTLLGAAMAGAQTADRDRIAQKVDASQVELVLGAVRPLAQAEFDQGPVPGSMPLHHVSIVFRLSETQQEDLDRLLADQQDTSSANYHKWLTPEQYADRFGLTRNDAAKVVSWLKSRGLTVESTPRGRTEIFFSGTAAQIATALRTEIHRYVINGKRHFANVTEPSVPSAVAGMVLGFRNLDDFRPKSRVRAGPHYTNSQGSHFLAPNDFTTIYDLQPLYTAGLDGTGVTIGVVGDSAITLSDIEAFRSASNLPAKDPTVVTVPGTGTAVHNSDEVEADLDIEWSGAVAKNASIIYYVAGNTSQGGAFDALDYAINPAGQTPVPVISNSFGLCETDEGSNPAQALRQLIQQANAQGQTVTSAAGDAGAADCDGDSPNPVTLATKGPSVDIPAAIPEITAVGGTEFNADVSNASLYWNGSNGAGGGSAIKYIPEVAWNDGPSPGTRATTNLAAGGGGASTFFAKPAWQTGTGVPSDGKRDVPDVALNASPFHDGYLICSQGSCTSGFSNGSTIEIVGGTSAGAPPMAGIIAIINQATKSCGLGNVNGSTSGSTGLYKLAALALQPSPFHDIAPPPTSSNIVPCTKGTTGCPASAPFQYGFSTTAGYDLVTGLGSVDADVLATNWPGFAPPQAVATTATVASNNPTANLDTNVIFTATMTTSGKACPSIAGTVQFTSDGSNFPGSPVPVSDGVATLGTTALAVGTHQIVANYQGDANYLASTSPTITQTITAVPDYTVSAPTPASLTLNPGASGTSTLTINANAVGFNGTVDLTCAPNSLTAQISCSLSPASFSLSSSTTGGQTVLTVKTAGPSAALASAGRGRRFSWIAASSGALFAGVLLIGVAPRRRWASIVCLVLVTFLSGGVGCGSSSGSKQGNSGTPPGSYSITVSSTSVPVSSGSGPHQQTIPLTVP
jgi:subtilase family serine protease